MRNIQKGSKISNYNYELLNKNIKSDGLMNSMLGIIKLYNSDKIINISDFD